MREDTSASLKHCVEPHYCELCDRRYYCKDSLHYRKNAWENACRICGFPIINETGICGPCDYEEKRGHWE